MRHGGNALIDHLAVESVSSVFLVPGESFLAALDALADAPQIKTVICRHEGGAAMMAAAWGRLTGRPGIALATRAPGAANALSGVVVAQADEAPMILFVGLAPTTTEQRGAFQEIDLEGLFSPVAKWVGVVRETARIPEFVARVRHRRRRPARPGRARPARERAVGRSAPWQRAAGCHGAGARGRRGR